MKRYFSSPVLFDEKQALQTINENSKPLRKIQDLDPLINKVGNCRVVMLGEATHGTHEYYSWRMAITQKLIQEKGFNFIAVEGDWPDCYTVNRFIKGKEGHDKTAIQVLQSFDRWPTWMWANWEMVQLCDWLKHHNEKHTAAKKVGFYGLDVYSLWESMEAIMVYLKKVDPFAWKIAAAAWHCFEPYQKEGQDYARASSFVPDRCTNEVVDLLREIRQKMPLYNTDHENVFNAEQNALVSVNAEKYYRAMIAGGPHSWNVRDRHMSDTLDRLLHFHGKDSKAIVWAHNTHIGDARATDMANEGMYNIGELARINHESNKVALIGFGSYTGTVIAAKNWGAPMKEMGLPSASAGSWEYYLHKSGPVNKWMMMEDFMQDVFLENHIGHRAVGVVYHPEREQYGNYVPSILPLRYDAFLFLNDTQALHPLHISPDGAQMPETYPFGV
jgi:erythromycin esterase-like protein